MNTDSIKLKIANESFWATKLTHNTATINNILFNSEYGLHDVVEFDAKTNLVTRLLVKKTNTCMLKYEAKSHGEAREKYSQIFKYFEKNGVEVEGMVIGTVLLAYPVGMPESRITELVDDCPVEVLLEMEED